MSHICLHVQAWNHTFSAAYLFLKNHSTNQICECMTGGGESNLVQGATSDSMQFLLVSNSTFIGLGPDRELETSSRACCRDDVILQHSLSTWVSVAGFGQLRLIHFDVGYPSD